MLVFCPSERAVRAVEDHELHALQWRQHGMKREEPTSMAT